MQSIEYKQATAEDIDKVINMRIWFSDVLVGKQSEENEKMMRAALHDYFADELDKNYLCWYATVDGELASMAGLVMRRVPGNIRNPTGRWGYIMNVFTLPQYRRMGLSKGVMARLMQHGREQGVKAFELHATPEGEHVYVNMGFFLHNEPTYRLFAE